MKTDFISSLAERPLLATRDREKEEALSHILNMRKKFNTNTETTGTLQEWVEPNQRRIMMINDLAGTEEAERLTKINTQMSRTMFNKSSVTHNIISNSDNYNNIDVKTGKRSSSRAGNSILVKKPHNYKKSIGNFIDVETANNPHVN